MSLKDAPYYWVECDGCGERAEYGEFSAMSDPGQAIDLALTEADFTTDGVLHHCQRCPSLFVCDECGKPAGDLAGERDYLCEACDDKMQAEQPQAVTP